MINVDDLAWIYLDSGELSETPTSTLISTVVVGTILSYYLVVVSESDISLLPENINIEFITQETCRHTGINQKYLHYPCISIPSKCVFKADDNFYLHDKPYVWVKTNSYQGVVAFRTECTEGFQQQQLEVIGKKFNKPKWKMEYCLLLPENSISGVQIDQWLVEEFEIPVYELGKIATLVGSEYLTLDSSPPEPVATGMKCMNRYCQEFFPYAEGYNLPNNIFLCYSCRTNPITLAIVTSKLGNTS